MIQDIKPHQFHNEFRPHPPTPDSRILNYHDRTIMVKKTDDHQLCFPTFQNLYENGLGICEQYTYLFSIDSISYYAFPEVETFLPEGYEFISLQQLRYAKPQYLAFAGVTGYQLYEWYVSRRFCGKCGRPLQKDTKERMLYCDFCKQVEYPVISPAVIVAITNGDSILLSKYADREYKKYALIAGFTEVGETVEETIQREVMEEVGLNVKNIRYYKSQPWSFTGSLLLGFFCDVDGDDTIHMDSNELSIAKWVKREEISDLDSDISLTNEMITQFRLGLEE